MVAEKEGTPIFVKNWGRYGRPSGASREGGDRRPGRCGRRRDVGAAWVQSLSGSGTGRKKIEEFNKWKLPEGVKIKTLYDRTALIHTTVETVMDILISGMVLVFVILFVFLGHFRPRSSSR